MIHLIHLSMPFITHALYFCILLSSLLFFISYFREPRRIQNGLFFLLSYFSITSFICLFTAEFLPASTLQSILFYISIGLFSLPIIVFSFILALSILIFLITDIILVFREGLKKKQSSFLWLWTPSSFLDYRSSKASRYYYTSIASNDAYFLYRNTLLFPF